MIQRNKMSLPLLLQLRKGGCAAGKKIESDVNKRRNSSLESLPDATTKAQTSLLIFFQLYRYFCSSL